MTARATPPDTRSRPKLRAQRGHRHIPFCVAATRRSLAYHSGSRERRADGTNMNTIKTRALAGLLSIALPAVGCWSDGGGARTPTGTCTSDATCPSGFCDRGVCAAPGPNITYGAECEPTPPGGFDRCGAYLCINHRCRSCTADSECSEGSPEVTCNSLPDEPGRRCGRLIDPGPPQPPPPPSEFPKPPSTP